MVVRRIRTCSVSAANLIQNQKGLARSVAPQSLCQEVPVAAGSATKQPLRRRPAFARRCCFLPGGRAPNEGAGSLVSRNGRRRVRAGCKVHCQARHPATPGRPGGRIAPRPTARLPRHPVRSPALPCAPPARAGGCLYHLMCRSALPCTSLCGTSTDRPPRCRRACTPPRDPRRPVLRPRHSVRLHDERTCHMQHTRECSWQPPCPLSRHKHTQTPTQPPMSRHTHAHTHIHTRTCTPSLSLSLSLSLSYARESQPHAEQLPHCCDTASIATTFVRLDPPSPPCCPTVLLLRRQRLCVGNKLGFNTVGVERARKRCRFAASQLC